MPGMGPEDQAAQAAMTMLVELPTKVLMSVPDIIKLLIEAAYGTVTLSREIAFGHTGKENGGLGGVVGIAESIKDGSVQLMRRVAEGGDALADKRGFGIVKDVTKLSGERREAYLDAFHSVKLQESDPGWKKLSAALIARGVKAHLVPNENGSTSILCESKDYEMLLSALIAVGVEDLNCVSQEEVDEIIDDSIGPEPVGETEGKAEEQEQEKSEQQDEEPVEAQAEAEKQAEKPEQDAEASEQAQAEQPDPAQDAKRDGYAPDDKTPSMSPQDAEWLKKHAAAEEFQKKAAQAQTVARARENAVDRGVAFDPKFDTPEGSQRFQQAAEAGYSKLKYRGYEFVLMRDMPMKNEGRTCYCATINGYFVSVDLSGAWSIAQNGKRLVVPNQSPAQGLTCDDGVTPWGGCSSIIGDLKHGMAMAIGFAEHPEKIETLTSYVGNAQRPSAHSVEGLATNRMYDAREAAAQSAQLAQAAKQFVSKENSPNKGVGTR